MSSVKQKNRSYNHVRHFVHKFQTNLKSKRLRPPTGSGPRPHWQQAVKHMAANNAIMIPDSITINNDMLKFANRGTKAWYPGLNDSNPNDSGRSELTEVALTSKTLSSLSSRHSQPWMRPNLLERSSREHLNFDIQCKLFLA